MMRIYLFILLGLLVTGSLSAQNEGRVMKKYENQLPQAGRGNARVAYQGKSIDQMIYEFMEEKGIPGITLAIVQAPYIPRVVGYGVTDIEKGKLATAKTIWTVGQIAQGFAAVAIMQLYEKGKLDLNDPLSKYFKKLPGEWEEITILQLMQHSTGIADYREQDGFDVSVAYTPEKLLQMVEDIPLAFTRGTDVKQSATNFLLLALIVEKAGKMPYHDFVKKYQIDYLGLRDTYFGEELDKIKQEDLSKSDNKHVMFKRDREYINPTETTVGYRDEDGQLVETVMQIGSMKGFADIWASAEDISHWDIALAGAVLITKPENRDIIYKPTQLANGKVVPAMAGWQFYNHKGLMDMKGSIPGHSVFLSRFTDASELVCVTLFANKEGVDLTNLGRKIAAAFDERLGSGANDNLLYTYESQFSVDETIGRIEKALKTLDIPVFAVFDHGKNAEEVGLELRPNKVIVFGAPKVGTKLMQENPSISIELPLKISVWEDQNGSVWASFPMMKTIKEEYGMENNPILNGMQTLLENLVRKSANVYTL